MATKQTNQIEPTFGLSAFEQDWAKRTCARHARVLAERRREFYEPLDRMIAVEKGMWP